MELKYKYVLYAGIVVVFFLLILAFIQIKKKKKGYEGGKKVASSFYTRNENFFKKKMLRFKLYTAGIFALGLVCISTSFFMISRPYKTEIAVNEAYSRDIIFCIDISYSVDYLNEHLIGKIKDTVKKLKGERFGIVIFNSSPVLLAPLTDDYEFILEELDILEEALKARSKIYEVDDQGYLIGYNYFNVPDNWAYLDSYISAGTLVGNDLRGSSLTGDGLAAAAFDFSDKEEDKNRTKVIIFSTDNLVNGEPIVPLLKASEFCSNNDITVYGIGTKEMEPNNREEMKNAVERTGGSFFLEEESGDFDEIVTEIEKKSKSLVNNGTYIKYNEFVKLPFILLLSSFFGMLMFIKVTRR